uniref:Uncharacterized protein n=1 Tax=Anguilla anguilla TaxID=7936 RepID=A0A0E9VFC5_ANGAN
MNSNETPTPIMQQHCMHPHQLLQPLPWDRVQFTWKRTAQLV